jgi:hypothetical protein
MNVIFFVKKFILFKILDFYYLIIAKNIYFYEPNNYSKSNFYFF